MLCVDGKLSLLVKTEPPKVDGSSTANKLTCILYSFCPLSQTPSKTAPLPHKFHWILPPCTRLKTGRPRVEPPLPSPACASAFVPGCEASGCPKRVPGLNVLPVGWFGFGPRGRGGSPAPPRADPEVIGSAPNPVPGGRGGLTPRKALPLPLPKPSEAAPIGGRGVSCSPEK